MCWACFVNGGDRNHPDGNMGEHRQTCGTILRQLRKERGWSLEETVQQVGSIFIREYDGRECPLTISMVGKWERDEHLPAPKYRKLFCLLYKQTASQLGFIPPT